MYASKRLNLRLSLSIASSFNFFSHSSLPEKA
jgi:hypothetical protein